MDFDSKKIDGLPGRPLSESDVERLVETASQDLVVTPSSMMTTEDGESAVTTMIFFRQCEETWTYLGYNPGIEGWEAFEQLGEGEYSQKKSNEIIDQWARETYGEDGITHSSYEMP